MIWIAATVAGGLALCLLCSRHYAKRTAQILAVLSHDEWRSGKQVQQLSGVSNYAVYAYLAHMEDDGLCRSRRICGGGAREYLRTGRGKRSRTPWETALGRAVPT